VVDQTVAGAGGVGTDQHRLVPRGRGELREREIGQLDQIGGGVAFPQDRGQWLGSRIQPKVPAQSTVDSGPAIWAMNPRRPAAQASPQSPATRTAMVGLAS
jgi:hypothetical protein